MPGKTIVALYDDFADAVRAVRALEEAGFQHEDLNLVANNAENRWGDADAARRAAPAHETKTHGAGGAETGAAVGAVAGGTAGLLASLGVLAIPGIGPVLAAGPLVALIAGAGVGATAGGVIGGLVGLGVPEEEAHAYAEGLRRGGALVTAKVADAQVPRAIEILDRHDAVDVEERQAGWRDTGWRRFDERAEPWSAKSIAGERAQRRSARTTTGTEPKASEAGLRHGIIRQESETARMSGGPVPTAMSGMMGSPEGLQEQKEPLKRHGDMARPSVRSYESETTSPSKQVNRAMDRAAAGDKPTQAEAPDRYGGVDKLAGRK
jgi:hypothetical protein